MPLIIPAILPLIRSASPLSESGSMSLSAEYACIGASSFLRETIMNPLGLTLQKYPIFLPFRFSSRISCTSAESEPPQLPFLLTIRAIQLFAAFRASSWLTILAKA